MHGQNQSLLLHHHRRLQIPIEILFDEILPRLPVKSLLRFQCVSKSWLSLIESEKFIETHYQNSSKSPTLAHHGVVLSPMLHSGKNYSLEECSLLRLLKSKNEGYVTTSKHNQPRKECVAVGCCNGVVCLYDYERGSFSLWNPSTRSTTQLPKRGGCLRAKYGFGWDESSDAYKVFGLFYDDGYNAVSVYSSETDSWKPCFDCKVISFGSGSGLFAGGSLHWYHHGSWHGIESFDLEMEVFGRIELPPDVAKSVRYCGLRLHLGVIRGSLSILFDDVLNKSFEVWVMKEHGVKDSWLKISSFPCNDAVCKRELFMNNGLRIALFGEGPNGEVFVVYGDECMVYSPKDDTLTSAKNSITIGRRTAHVYVESLVSPRRGGEASLKADYI